MDLNYEGEKKKPNFFLSSKNISSTASYFIASGLEGLVLFSTTAWAVYALGKNTF